MRIAISAASKRTVAGLAALLLAACSTVQFVYNNAEGLVRYLAYDYLDLADEQDADFRQRVARFLDWHRARELPRYVHAAGEIGQRLGRGITEADVAWAIAEGRARYRASAAHAAGELAPLLAGLSETQIVDLEKRLEKSNLKFEKEYVAGDEAKLQRERTRSMIDRFEDFTGRLGAAQRARIERFVRETPSSAAIRLAERRRWQREAVAVLRRHREARALAPELTRLFADPERGRPAEYLRETRRWEADLGRLIAELDATLSSEQRGRAITRVARYGEDFRALSGGVVMTGMSPAPSSAPSTTPSAAAPAPRAQPQSF